MKAALTMVKEVGLDVVVGLQMRASLRKGEEGARKDEEREG